MKLKATTLLACLPLLAAMPAAAGEIAFEGNSKPACEITPAKSTGLNKIYVLYDTQGVGMSYKPAREGNTVVWTKWTAGAAYGQELPQVKVLQDGTSYLAQVEPNCGYTLQEGDSYTYVWVMNYADYRLRLEGIAPDGEGDCSTATLKVEGSGPEMTYYTITGVRKSLDRDMKLSYSTLVCNSDTTAYESRDTTETEENFKSTLVVPAPLCNTTFTLTGDRFLDYWGESQSVTSDLYTTQAIACTTRARQETRNNDNERTSDTEGVLGGSAPATITFSAIVTDAVNFKEWQEATDADFNNIILQLSDLETTQTFTEAGTYYWRFTCSNGNGTCDATSSTYTVNIGESELLVPNFFSPGSTEGVNDVWKVSYKSIVKFHCWIFNSWGTQVCELKDPGQGWDGKYKGKLVDPGVYYYVIQAEGSDGHKYKKSGDINILRYKKNNGTGTGTTTGE